MKKIASIEILNDKRMLPAALHFLDCILANVGVEDRLKKMQFRLAAEEVLHERIERAFPGAKNFIYVDFFVSYTQIEISVRDKGTPDWKGPISYDPACAAQETSGLEDFIAVQMVDELGTEKLGKNGQRVYLRMNLPNPLEEKQREAARPEAVLDTNLSIREVRTEADVIEAIRCIYHEYGYSYSYEKLYYVDNFMDLVRQGKLRSFLAVNEHGQVAGHFALSFAEEFPRMPEISTVVINRNFRGLRLFSLFMEHSLQVAKQMKMRAVMGQPVAFHPMSQKAVAHAGFTATALLFAYVGADMESEYNKARRRLDVTACVKILDETAESTIYAPEEAWPVLDRIYRNLGWRYEVRPCGAPRGESELKADTNSGMKTTRIVVRRAGESFRDELAAITKAAMKNKVEMIELLLLLNDPSCGYAYEQAKAFSYIFTGCIPGGAGGDYLVMQNLMGEDARYDRLVTVGQFEALQEMLQRVGG